jgi:hypothetical protein
MCHPERSEESRPYVKEILRYPKTRCHCERPEGARSNLSVAMRLLRRPATQASSQ